MSNMIALAPAGLPVASALSHLSIKLGFERQEMNPFKRAIPRNF
jgi:hypothetical protein